MNESAIDRGFFRCVGHVACYSGQIYYMFYGIAAQDFCFKY